MPSMLRHQPNCIIGRRDAVVAAALSLAVLALTGCNRKAPDPVATDVQTETPTTTSEPAAPAVPAPRPVLTRGDLVSAAGQAASAFAEGKAPSTADPLVGRSFAVRVPFGCHGPIPAGGSQAEGDGLAAWTWGPDRKSIELRMTPSEWTGSAMLAKAGAPEKWEAVEGFWIPRPWLASETCPAVKADPLQTGASPASPQTVGLAAAFEAGGSRLGRRNGRAYEHSVRMKGDTPLTPSESGFRMLLEGRVASFPSGRAIECSAPGPDQRPVCIIAIQLDRVAYEDANGSTLSEWHPG
jgi:hypothetical protein